MPPELKQLLILQERDQQLLALKKDLDHLPKLRAAAEARLGGDKAAAEQAQAKVMEQELAIKNLELDIGTRRNTIQRLEDQRFETRKNEEFRALGNEVERYKNEIDALEERELGHMETLEEARKVLIAAQGRLAETGKLVKSELEALDQREANVRSSMQELIGERKQLAAAVDEDLRVRYERLLVNKGGTAVVPVDHGVCQGCHMKVISSTLVELKAAKSIVSCGNCGRILYLGEEA